MSVDPYLLKALLDGADGRAGLGSSLCIVFLLGALMLVRVSCMEVCYFVSVRATNNARTAVTQALFRRAIAARVRGRMNN